MSRVQGSGFRVQGSGFRVQGSGVEVWGAVCSVQCAVCSVQGLGCGVQGSDRAARLEVEPTRCLPNIWDVGFGPYDPTGVGSRVGTARRAVSSAARTRWVCASDVTACATTFIRSTILLGPNEFS